MCLWTVGPYESVAKWTQLVAFVPQTDYARHTYILCIWPSIYVPLRLRVSRILIESLRPNISTILLQISPPINICELHKICRPIHFWGSKIVKRSVRLVLMKTWQLEDSFKDMLLAGRRDGEYRSTWPNFSQFIISKFRRSTFPNDKRRILRLSTCRTFGQAIAQWQTRHRLRLIDRSWYRYPTDPFTTLELQNLPHDASELHTYN